MGGVVVVGGVVIHTMMFVAYTCDCMNAECGIHVAYTCDIHVACT